jgi:uncharacterized protein YndB with AHSA1/START domain
MTRSTTSRASSSVSTTSTAGGTTTTVGAATCSLVITRVLDAPRALVFRAWTDPVHVARWWGPKSFTNPVCELDVRPGGTLRIVMRAPDGTDYPMTGTFHDVVEPERLSFTDIPLDAAGNRLAEGFTTVTFAEEGGRTRLTVETSATALPGAEWMLEGMDQGWTQSIDRLEEMLAAR